MKSDVVGNDGVSGLVVGELEMLAGELGEPVEIWRNDGAGRCNEPRGEVARDRDVPLIASF